MAFVVEIATEWAEVLKKDLPNMGFELTTPPHTFFQAKKRGVSCTFYHSGKLSIQGKEMDEFIAQYIEPKVLQSFIYTHREAYVDKKPRIGIDEAGKGDFFGPLTVAGVYASEDGIKKLLALDVKDSKKMNDKTILRLAKEIRKSVDYHVVVINPQKYNEIYPKFKNLNRLLAWGHATCIQSLVETTGCSNVLIDQFAHEEVVETALQKKGIHTTLEQRHKGESDVVVAAASMLAREAFLKGLSKLGESIQCTLPKGASGKVVEVGQNLYHRYGESILLTLAKKHFKTWLEVTK